MSESITSVDMNFANGGGSHTATVTSILNTKNPDGSETLGFVEGEMGQKNTFSKERLNELMERFVLTDKIKNSDPFKTIITRKYADETSLRLNSYIVLVRGMNAPPVGTNKFPPEGSPWGESARVPYYGEVVNSPTFSFGSSPPALIGTGDGGHKNVILAGRIYNVESESQFNGVKMTLVYQNKQLVENLSLNHQFVSPDYLLAPDYAQFNLKFGYTFEDFKAICRLAKIEVEWPEKILFSEKILFQSSGTLASVLSSICSYFGYYNYVNPVDGKIYLIDSKFAASLDIEDPTLTTDENITNATYTESKISNNIVNTYVGSTEKPEEGEGLSATNDPDNAKLRSVFFKRVLIEERIAEALKITNKELGAFFEIFNQGVGEETFDKYAFILLVLGERERDFNGELGVCGNHAGGGDMKKPQKAWPPMDRFGPFGNGLGGPLYLRGDITENRKGLPTRPLYTPVPARCAGGLQMWNFGPSDSLTNAEKKNEEVIWASRIEAKNNADGARFSRVDINGDNNAKYFKMVYDENEWARANPPNARPNEGKWLANYLPMPRPSTTPLFKFLKAFYQIAGGVYISNVFGSYKAHRTTFDNANNLTIVGPLKGDKKIREVDDLKALSDVIEVCGIDPNITVKTLAQLTRGAAKLIMQEEGYFWIALRALPKAVVNNNGVELGRAEFDLLEDLIELYQGKPQGNAPNLYVGGIALDVVKLAFFKDILKQVKKSQILWRFAREETQDQNQLKMTYRRSKTRVNTMGEEGEIEEDNKISGYDATDQKLAELFDRYDLKNYEIEAEKWSLLSQPSLSASSGSTTEMEALVAARGANATEVGGKLKSSQKTIYGFEIPDFEATTSSLSFSVEEGGITTTIGHSTLKILPPDQNFLQLQGMQVVSREKILPRLTAAQKNYLGL